MSGLLFSPAALLAAFASLGCSRNQAAPIEPARDAAAASARAAGSAASAPSARPTATATSSASAAPPVDPRRQLAIDFLGWKTSDFIGLKRISLPRSERERLHAEAKKACKAGDMLGCTLDAFWTEWDDQNEAAARLLHLKACEANEMIACARIAQHWACFYPDETVLLTHRMICNAADPIALFLMDKGTDRENAQRSGLSGARALGMKACDAGIAAGCVTVASSYEQAVGDLEKARVLYARACDMGHWNGCERARFVSQGLSNSSPEAAEWVAEYAGKGVALLAKACDEGVLGVCGLAGSAYAEPKVA